MIDTIVYKIHRVKANYPVFYEAIDLIRNEGKGRLKIENKTGKDFDGLSTNWDKAYINISKNLFFVEPYTIQKNIASSSNHINIAYDPQRDIAKIEFSIPKFFFSNNVIELIPGLKHKYFVPGQYAMTDNLKFCMKIIRSVITTIFSDVTFGAEKVKFTDVQISRVDICYNQIFPREFDALQYLEHMKKVRYPKGSETMFRPFDYAITFNNPRWYFKCYHKGKEFSKNGYKDVLDNVKILNDNKKPIPPFLALTASMISKNDNILQQYADQILRYELEAKNGFLSYVFNQRLKKKYIPYYKDIRSAVRFLYSEASEKYFRQLDFFYVNNLGEKSKKSFSKNDRFIFLLPVNVIDELNDSNHFAEVKDLKIIQQCERILIRIQTIVSVLKFHDYFDFSKLHLCDRKIKTTIKKLYDFFEKEDNLTGEFFLDIENKSAEFCYHGSIPVVKGNKEFDKVELLDETFKTQKFSINLLRECVTFHNKFFDRLQLHKLPKSGEIKMVVEVLNAKKKEKKVFKGQAITHRESSIVFMYQTLAKYGSLDEVKKAGILSNSTIKRWRAKIKEIDGTNANFIYERFTDNFNRDMKQAYKRHYSLCYNAFHPLPKFINYY